MDNPTPVLENDKHKLLWDFDLQTDHLILARRPDKKKSRKKRTYRIVDFAVLVDHWVELNENERMDKYLDLARKLIKTVEHESDVYINYN